MAQGYFYGMGLKQDIVQAMMWANLSAAQQNVQAAMLKKTIQKNMKRQDINNAQRLTREWKPKA
jgi:TPR repeat protein